MLSIKMPLMLRLFFLVFISLKCFAQNAPVSIPNALSIVTQIPAFVDSLRAKLLLDTIKFDAKDVLRTAIGNRNYKSYSPLFFINMRYLYKLDIVDGNSVKSFVNGMLISDKIESISLMDESKSQSIFGSNGKNGTIIISFKPDAHINLQVAGFRVTKRGGNNFEEK